MELYDVPEVDGFPIAIFSEQDDDGPASGSFTDLVFLDDFTRNAQLLARTDSLTQDSTFKVRVYGYMVKGLMAGKMASARFSNAADELFNLPPGYSVNDDINDPNCGLPIDAVEDNIFVNCIEFRIGEPDFVQELDILLGESKYFYAISDPNDNTKLQIKEYEAEDSIPSTLPNDGISDAFNTDNFVEIVSGDKAGIYWERKGAIISDKGEITTTDLPEGMIRVIGRYWEADQVYSVKLKATSSNRSGELDIKVTKPARLGTEYSKAKDVFDKEYNVDSLLVKYAGEYGIPPQWLKGQADIESVKTPAFQLSTGNRNGFHPGFRYEGLNWEFTVRNRVDVNGDKYSEGPFWVTETSMGENNPPVHSHTRYQNYYTTPTTVWDIVKEYSDLVEDKSLRLYARKDENRLNFISYGYKNLQNVYNDEIYPFFEEDFEGDSLYIISRDSMATYLKNIWKGPVDNEPENFEDGLNNLYAQTRLASSYGILQTMYVTATERGYTISSENKPEDLNENKISFPIFMKHHIKNLKTIVGSEYLEGSNWDYGFENVLKELMQKWNPYKTDYDDLVTASQKKFNPSND